MIVKQRNNGKTASQRVKKICIHKECGELLSHEGFYNEDDYGTDDDFFHNAIFDYVNEHHLSDNGEAFDEGWDGDNYHLVKMILKELEV